MIVLVEYADVRESILEVSRLLFRICAKMYMIVMIPTNPKIEHRAIHQRLYRLVFLLLSCKAVSGTALGDEDGSTKRSGIMSQSISGRALAPATTNSPKRSRRARYATSSRALSS
jgi:hypothetical protein